MLQFLDVEEMLQHVSDSSQRALTSNLSHQVLMAVQFHLLLLCFKAARLAVPLTELKPGHGHSASSGYAPEARSSGLQNWFLFIPIMPSDHSCSVNVRPHLPLNLYVVCHSDPGRVCFAPKWHLFSPLDAETYSSCTGRPNFFLPVVIGKKKLSIVSLSPRDLNLCH